MSDELVASPISVEILATTPVIPALRAEFYLLQSIKARHLDSRHFFMRSRELVGQQRIALLGMEALDLAHAASDLAVIDLASWFDRVTSKAGFFMNLREHCESFSRRRPSTTDETATRTAMRDKAHGEAYARLFPESVTDSVYPTKRDFRNLGARVVSLGKRVSTERNRYAHRFEKPKSKVNVIAYEPDELSELFAAIEVIMNDLERVAANVKSAAIVTAPCEWLAEELVDMVVFGMPIPFSVRLSSHERNALYHHLRERHAAHHRRFTQPFNFDAREFALAGGVDEFVDSLRRRTDDS